MHPQIHTNSVLEQLMVCVSSRRSGRATALLCVRAATGPYNNSSSEHLHGCGVSVVKMEHSFKSKGLCEHLWKRAPQSSSVMKINVFLFQTETSTDWSMFGVRGAGLCVVAYFCRVRLRLPVQLLILFWASRWFMPSVAMPSMDRTTSPTVMPPLAAFPPSVSCRDIKKREMKNMTSIRVWRTGWVKVM